MLLCNESCSIQAVAPSCSPGQQWLDGIVVSCRPQDVKCLRAKISLPDPILSFYHVPCLDAVAPSPLPISPAARKRGRGEGVLFRLWRTCMPITFKCPSCGATLRLRDDAPGSEFRCPRCRKVAPRPATEPADEGITEVEPASSAPPNEGTKSCPFCGRSIAATARKCRFCRSRLDERRQPGRRTGGRYKPCPRCGAHGAERVSWTFWGSFYGPALFSHVRCPECGHGYNGKTGGSNLIPAIFFVTIPAIGIVALLGFIAWMIIKVR
jgi:hypothetical protein